MNYLISYIESSCPPDRLSSCVSPNFSLRESVQAPAKPVLFGNAHRLSPLDQRADPFTEKCVAAALTMNTALVSTPDLFLAVQNHVECQDADFSAACRLAILSAVGPAAFPVPSVSVRQSPRDIGKALKSQMSGLWRYQVGNYRVVCEIQDTAITVLVVRIGHRRDVYRL